MKMKINGPYKKMLFYSCPMATRQYYNACLFVERIQTIKHCQAKIMIKMSIEISSAHFLGEELCCNDV